MPLVLQLALCAIGIAVLIGSARRVFPSKGRPVTEAALRQRSSDLSRLNWFAVFIGYGAFAFVAVGLLNVPDPLPSLLGYGAGALVLLYLGSQVVAGWKDGMRNSGD